MATVGAAGRGSAALDLASQAPVPTPSPLRSSSGCTPPQGQRGTQRNPRSLPCLPAWMTGVHFRGLCRPLTLGCFPRMSSLLCAHTHPPGGGQGHMNGCGQSLTSLVLDSTGGGTPGPSWCENEWGWKEKGSPGQGPPPEVLSCHTVPHRKLVNKREI